MDRNGEVFVTYKWLFATAISLLLITLGFVYFAYGGMNKALESKADIRWVETRAEINKARIDMLYSQLEKMSDKQDSMMKEIYNIRDLIKKGR